jgi:hypothetical protein
LLGFFALSTAFGAKQKASLQLFVTRNQPEFNQKKKKQNKYNRLNASIRLAILRQPLTNPKNKKKETF